MRYLPNRLAFLSIVLSSTLGALAATADTPMAQAPPAAYVAPEPDAEIDAECPKCGATWHLRFYSDMPMKVVYRLGEGQTWGMLLNHMRCCEKSIGRMLTA